MEIFIVSFRRDAAFLVYCLRSIQKFCIGFAGVTVMVPSDQIEEFAFVRDFGVTLNGFREWTPNGFMHHADQIVCADLWCPDADAIVFVDSDCMFWEPATPEDYFVDGKPVLFIERFDTLTNRLRMNWKDAVTQAIGLNPAYETMVRHPAVHLPEVHRKTRQMIEAHTGQEASRYIVSCRGDFPQTFAEFPTIGAVAVEHFEDRYHLVEHDIRTPDGGYEYVHGRDKLKAMWSHGGIDAYREQCEEILR